MYLNFLGSYVLFFLFMYDACALRSCKIAQTVGFNHILVFFSQGFELEDLAYEFSHSSPFIFNVMFLVIFHVRVSIFVVVAFALFFNLMFLAVF